MLLISQFSTKTFTWQAQVFIPQQLCRPKLLKSQNLWHVSKDNKRQNFSQLRTPRPLWWSQLPSSQCSSLCWCQATECKRTTTFCSSCHRYKTINLLHKVLEGRLMKLSEQLALSASTRTASHTSSRQLNSNVCNLHLSCTTLRCTATSSWLRPRLGQSCLA